MACHAGGTYAQQATSLANPLDILVATPQKLLQHAEKGNVFYGDVQYVVLDEADTMFDRGFGPEVEKILGPLRSKPEPAHCILVAATLTTVGLMFAVSCPLVLSVLLLLELVRKAVAIYHSECHVPACVHLWGCVTE